MQPLRVTIRLADPIVRGAFPLMLDGLVAYCCIEDQLAFLDDTNDDRPIHALAAQLPFQRVEQAGHPTWCASAFLPIGRIDALGNADLNVPSGPTSMRQITRRSDIYEFADAVEKGLVSLRGVNPKEMAPNAYLFDTSRGLFKGMLMSYSLKHVSALEAWCIGERESIEHYLSGLDFIGPKRRLGHGKVRDITVVPDERAGSLWRLRPLPIDAATKNDDTFAFPVDIDMPATAPYWQSGKAVRQRAPASIFW